jgi:hypothetical protein
MTVNIDIPLFLCSWFVVWSVVSFLSSISFWKKKNNLVKWNYKCNILSNLYHQINFLNWATFLCMFKARTWISIGICHSLYCVEWSEARGNCFVDIDEIVEPSLFYFLFTSYDNSSCSIYKEVAGYLFSKEEIP